MGGDVRDSNGWLQPRVGCDQSESVRSQAHIEPKPFGCLCSNCPDIRCESAARLGRSGLLGDICPIALVRDQWLKFQPIGKGEFRIDRTAVTIAVGRK